MRALRRALTLVLAPAESLMHQVPRALVVAVLALVVDFGIMFLLVNMLHIDTRLACVVGYLTGGILQYVACSAWVFPNAPRNVALGFVAFTVLSLGGLAITVLSLQLLNCQWGWDWKLAKVVALGLAFNWNFFTRKFFLFQPEETTIPAPQ